MHSPARTERQYTRTLQIDRVATNSLSIWCGNCTHARPSHFISIPHEHQSFFRSFVAGDIPTAAFRGGTMTVSFWKRRFFSLFFPPVHPFVRHAVALGYRIRPLVWFCESELVVSGQWSVVGSWCRGRGRICSWSLQMQQTSWLFRIFTRFNMCEIAGEFGRIWPTLSSSHRQFLNPSQVEILMPNYCIYRVVQKTIAQQKKPLQIEKVTKLTENISTVRMSDL